MSWQTSEIILHGWFLCSIMCHIIAPFVSLTTRNRRDAARKKLWFLYSIIEGKEKVKTRGKNSGQKEVYLKTFDETSSRLSHLSEILPLFPGKYLLQWVCHCWGARLPSLFSRGHLWEQLCITATYLPGTCSVRLINFLTSPPSPLIIHLKKESMWTVVECSAVFVLWDMVFN